MGLDELTHSNRSYLKLMEYHLRTRDAKAVIVDRLLDFWLDHRLESKYICIWRAFIAVRNKEKEIAALERVIEEKDRKIIEEGNRIAVVIKEKEGFQVRLKKSTKL